MKENSNPLGNDPRIRDLLKGSLVEGESPKVVLIGFPSDEGVRRNNGRRGAANAPDQIRKALCKLTPDARFPEQFSTLIRQTHDSGDIPVTGDLEKDQQKLGEEVGAYLKKGVIPIILGGGHETAFGHFWGYVRAGLKVSVFNLDAHTDVRPLKKGKAHSGSPFRQVMEHHSDCCGTYFAAGLQPASVSINHLNFITENGGNYRFRDETDISFIEKWFQKQESERLMVTFDMDSVDQAFAPGVSAPCANGLSSTLFTRAAYLAGKCLYVASFDVSEVNPEYDRDGQTSKLAALAVWNFLAGISHRK